MCAPKDRRTTGLEQLYGWDAKIGRKFAYWKERGGKALFSRFTLDGVP